LCRDYPDLFNPSGGRKCRVKRRERYVVTLSELEIDGIIERQSMATRQGKDIGFLWLGSVQQAHPRKPRKCVGGSFFVATATTFRDEHTVAQFEPPMWRHQRIFEFDPPQSLSGVGMILVRKEPTYAHRRIENERHLFPPFVAPSQDFVPGHARHALSQFLYFCNGLCNFALALLAARHQRSDRFAMSGDNDSFAPLDLV